MSKVKVSPATEIVRRAQSLYPERLASVKAYMGDIPYGKQLVSPRTADKRLVEMTPDALYQLSIQDPVAAEQAAQRIATLDARAAALPPASDDFE